MKPKANPFLILSAACIAIGITSTSAATWTGAANASWATTGNWSDNSAPNGTITYDGTSTANLTQTLDGSHTVTGITLTSPTGAVVVNNGTGTNTLAIGSGGINLSSAAQNLTLNVSTTANATQSWNIASGRTLLRSGGTTTFDTGTTTTMSGAGTVEFGGTQVLAGSGTLIVDGPTLFNNLQGGTQTRSGTTTLTSGIIKIQTGVSMFGSGALNINGGAIGSGNTTARTIGNNVNVGGSFRVGGTGLSTGAIVFSGPVDLGAGVRSIESAVSAVVTNTGAGTILTGIVSNGGITKDGSGILTISNSGNTFTGATTVNAGSLAISRSALLNSASVTLANTGAQLYLGENGAGTHTLNNLSGVAGTSIRTDFTLSGTNANRSLTVNQSVSGEFAGNFVQGGSRSFEIVKTGTGTLTLSGTGGHTLGTTISAGTLKIGGAGLLGAATYAGAISNNATLHFDSTAAQTLTGTLTGTGTLLKSNSGALTISGTATGFTGSTTVSGGILTLGSAIGGNLGVSGGRLILNSSISGNISATSGGTFGGTGGSTGDLDMTTGSTLLLTGGATTTGMSFDGVSFGGTVYLEFASSPIDATMYDVVTYGAGGFSGYASLSPLARGTLTNDVANNKVTFTAGTPGTRTWNTGSGTWNRFGTLTNWAEADQVYYQGDDVVFGDITSDTTITLDGLLAPFKVTVENAGNAYTFAGTGGLSGSALFEKTGTGTLVIANPNPNFAGGTLIDAGIFRLIDGGSWGTGTITNNATLEIDQTTVLTLSGVISGTGSLVKNNTGTLRLTGANTYSGATILNSGILQAGANNAFGTGTLTINGGIISSDSATNRTLANNLVINTDPTFGDGTNTGQFTLDGTVDLQGSTRVITSGLANQGVRFNGVISNGGITKEGTGRVTLANDTNTFTGSTTINAGILATSTGALASSGSVTIGASGSLALGSNGTTVINNLGGVAGALIVSNFNITADGARTLQVNQTVSGGFAGSFNQDANRPISLVKSGSATLTLSGTGGFNGTTTVSAGVLKTSGAGLLGGATYAGAITNDATLHFDSTATQTLSGLVSGTGTLLKSNTGTLILTNNSAYTGPVTIDGGTLQVGNNTTAGFIGDGATITNNAALVWFRSNETNVGNAISGTGTLTKLGTAVLNLTGNSTYTGATNVNAGTLAVGGSLGNTAVTVANGATLAGNGNIGGSVTIQSGGTHTLAVAATSGSQVTRTIGGSLTLDSGNILSLTAATAPAAGTYILATATGGITGTPGTVSLAPEITGTVTISGNNLVLTVPAASDYDTWAGPSGFNLSQGPTGDDDGDGVTNFEEYAFGLNPTSASSVSPVTAPNKTAGTFTYTRRKQSLTNLTYSYESSTNLGGWNSFTPPTPDVSNNGDPVETITVTLPAVLLAEPKLFIHVKATQP